MRITAVYDNGGKSIDRYSIVTDGGSNDDPTIVDMLCVDDNGGHTYSQWGYGVIGRHLGKRIHFEDLDTETQAHVVKRLFTEMYL